MWGNVGQLIRDQGSETIDVLGCVTTGHDVGSSEHSSGIAELCPYVLTCVHIEKLMVN